jgi:hypothetical protein
MSSDPRFAALQKDPRYRLPSRKEARTAVDPRFKTLFTDQEFRKKATVDRYGRKVKPESGKKDLERLYRLEKPAKKKLEREVVGSEDDSEEEEEDDDEVESSEDEEQLVGKKDLARDGGFSESSSSEEETSDEEDEEGDEEVELADETAGYEQNEEIPVGDVYKRIACVNLDWDNMRAADIMAVATSFAPPGGKVESVTIYPSEYGRQRLEKEELEGPPREIFASSKRNEDESEEDEEDSSDDDEKIKQQLLKQQASEGEEFDTAKLRQYQLERLRYYYAVICCSDKTTAKTLYDAMDGREYLSTANFFDMRFIPDDTSFDEDTPHDECTQLPPGYKPNDFRTEALTHSKVRLTWDEDDATRKEVQKRAFSRAEMDENDLQAYIGSDDSDADSTTSRKSSAEDRRAQKAEAKRAKMRAALGLSDQAISSKKSSGKDEVVGDMQITFTSALSSNKNKDGPHGVFENEPQDEESTRARYIRREKERKQKRKERAKARAKGETSPDAQSDRVTSQAADDAGEGAKDSDDEDDEDDPFNDPFFTDPAAAAKAEKAAKQAEKEAKRAAKAAKDAEAQSRRAELELLMAGEEGEGGVAGKHFDMREIEKAEKRARRKGKKGKKGKDDGGEEDTFTVETEDPRFAALFERNEYAIDPTNPKFKKTKGMQRLLEEGRKKRKVGEGELEEDGEEREGKKAKKDDVSAGGDDVKGLVARLKSKNKGKKNA